MSANNQTLIQQYKDKWYVFTNVTAEEFGGYDYDAEKYTPTNILYLNEGIEFETRESAMLFAHDLESDYDSETEYGVWENQLAKDGTRVTIVDQDIINN